MRSGSGPRQELPPPSPSRATRRVLLTTPLLIVFALILLPAIAFASPPDPSWADGIFDGADGDDIVSLVYETSAARPATPSHLGPRPCLLETSLDRIARNAAGGRFTRGPRSPPVLCSPEFDMSSLLAPFSLGYGSSRHPRVDHHGPQRCQEDYRHAFDAPSASRGREYPHHTGGCR
jgi:hypothetical protein